MIGSNNSVVQFISALWFLEMIFVETDMAESAVASNSLKYLCDCSVLSVLYLYFAFLFPSLLYIVSVTFFSVLLLCYLPVLWRNKVYIPITTLPTEMMTCFSSYLQRAANFLHRRNRRQKPSQWCHFRQRWAPLFLWFLQTAKKIWLRNKKLDIHHSLLITVPVSIQG